MIFSRTVCSEEYLKQERKKAERYVKRIACWQQIVLGWLDEGWEGEGWDEMGREVPV